MQINHTIKLAIVGFISGLLSYFANYLPLLDTVSNWKLFITAGFVFGISMALYFLVLRRQTSPIKFLLWIAVSTGVYYVAVYTTIRFPFALSSPYEFFFPLIGGGIMGALLMLLGYGILLYPLNIKQMIVLTVLGGILGLSWYIIPAYSIFGPQSDAVMVGENLLSLYLFWQMGMAGALGWVMDRAGNGKNR